MNKWLDKRVGVLMGGLSSERDVSLNTGKGVLEALLERGYTAVGIDWRPEQDLIDPLRDANVDVVWNALHGTYGEDGAIQGLLTCLGIPCTGAGILASALAMDKVMSKRIFDSNGLPTPAWRVLDDDEGVEHVADWPLPAVVKPALEGSSVGVTIVREREHMAEAIAEARKYEGQTLVEAFVPGREVCAAVLAKEVIGTCEIRPATEFYDYAAKYQRSDTVYTVPAGLSEAEQASIDELSLAAHKAIGCTGYSRVDFRLTDAGELSILEVNTLPGMTGTSLLPKIAAHAGIDYPELCVRILDTAPSS